MTRPQFAAYRLAFVELIACAGGDEEKSVCATQWARAIGPLLGPDPRERSLARSMTEYYVAAVLRAHRGESPDCRVA